MIRVHVIVEGHTERSFVEGVLAPALCDRGIFVTARIIGIPGSKGGHANYQRLKKDVLILLKQESQTYCSTMLDLYALGAGFPGTPAPPDLTGAQIASRIEDAVKADIRDAVPDLRPDSRFLPHIQPHEYEGLLFSDPPAFAAALGCPGLSGPLQAIRDRFATPEDIDDSPETAPSKRVLRMHPRYRKVLQGTLAARAIGLDAIRRECPHFRARRERIERLSLPV